MKFTDGKFKILILSDIHNPEYMPLWTEKFIRYAMETEKPDLVVLLGDNTAGYYNGVSEEKNKTAIKKIVSLIGGTMFAIVFGNHDHEGLPHMSEDEAKEFLLSVYGEYDSCLAKGRDYSVNLKDSKGENDIFSLYFIDSGTYAKEGGYAYVQPEQLNWYKLECDKNGNLPSYLFQHIIFPEVYDLMFESKLPRPGFTKGQCIRGRKFYKFKGEYLLSGEMKEGPCPPDINGGQLDVVKEKGSTLACFFGHDHKNTFVCDCRGIRLAAVPSPSFYTYGNNRGVRVVTLHEDDLKSFDSKVIYYNDVMADRPQSRLVDKWGADRYERVTKKKAR